MFITFGYITVSVAMALVLVDAPSLMQASRLELVTPNSVESTDSISRANSSPLT